MTVILNGIENDRFFIDEKENWQTRIDLDEQTFTIGFFGRFMTQKGFKYLVAAIEEILKNENDHQQPVVLAFGWGGFIREEQAEIKRRRLEKNFHFLPFQNDPARAIRGVDVVVMPSLWEACPLLPMEVLVAGVPIIGTDCIGMREVLKDTPARIVPSADSRALAEAIIAEMQSSSKVKFEEYRNKAIQRFDVTNQVEQLQEIINRLVFKEKNI